MTSRRDSQLSLRLLALFALICVPAALAAPQDEVVKALKMKYPTTDTTPDRSQITQAGVIMRIVRNGVSAQPWDSFMPLDNPIADGSVQHHSRFAEMAMNTQAKLGQSRNVLALRPGDAVYITKIEVRNESKDDLLRLSILTCGPLDVDGGSSQKRYAATLTFKVSKGALAESSPDQLGEMVEAVLAPSTDTPPVNNTAASPQSHAAASTTGSVQSAVAQATVAKAVLSSVSMLNPISALSSLALSRVASAKAVAATAPTPAAQAATVPTQPVPAPVSKNIALGQTIAEVVATLGQPEQIVDLGVKKIYTYPNLKIVFLHGKVTGVD